MELEQIASSGQDYCQNMVVESIRCVAASSPCPSLALCHIMDNILDEKRPMTTALCLMYETDGIFLRSQSVSNGNLIVVGLYCLWSARIILDSTTWSISSIAIKLFRTHLILIRWTKAPRRVCDKLFVFKRWTLERRSLWSMRIYLAIFYEGNSVWIWRLSNSD